MIRAEIEVVPVISMRYMHIKMPSTSSPHSADRLRASIPPRHDVGIARGRSSISPIAGSNETLNVGAGAAHPCRERVPKGVEVYPRQPIRRLFPACCPTGWVRETEIG